MTRRSLLLDYLLAGLIGALISGTAVLWALGGGVC